MYLSALKDAAIGKKVVTSAPAGVELAPNVPERVPGRKCGGRVYGFPVLCQRISTGLVRSRRRQRGLLGLHRSRLLVHALRREPAPALLGLEQPRHEFSVARVDWLNVCEE